MHVSCVVASGCIVGGALAISTCAPAAAQNFSSSQTRNFSASAQAQPARPAETAGRRDIGEAAAIIRDVRGAAGQSLRRLVVADRVHANERLSAASGSVGQFRFLDDTRIVVGPNSSVVLDRFVYDPDRSARQVSISAVKGTFRFITGNSATNAYRIRTPTAVVGVRGTVFDGHVDSRGTTSILLLEGEVDACDRAGNCTTLDSPCQFVQIAAGAPQGAPQDIRSNADANATARELFPFLARADLLAYGFRAAATACARGAAPERAGSDSGDLGRHAGRAAPAAPADPPDNDTPDRDGPAFGVD